MSFRKTFPVTVWCWQRLTSSPARFLYLGVLLAIFIPGIVWRVESALFQRRVLRVVSALPRLRIGEASKADALSSLSGLNGKWLSRELRSCDADECYSIKIANLHDSIWRVAWLFGNSPENGDSPHMFKALDWWGLRDQVFSASILFESGKVSGFRYRLEMGPMAVGPVHFGAVMVSSRKHIDQSLAPENDQSPNYSAYPSKLADLTVNIEPDTPDELVRHAFNLRLNCIWSLSGCRSASKLLPEVEQDRVRIEHAAVERLQGPEPCPEWILPHRVRAEGDILLVEVENVSPTPIQDQYYGPNSGIYGSPYRLASLRVLRTLKGEPRRAIEPLRVMITSSVGPLEMRNPDLDLLVAGRKLLVFSSDYPCAVVDGTDSVVRAIEVALGASGEGTHSSTAPR